MTSESKETHPGGRPSEYKPEMCETLIRVMSEGASKTEACLELGISRETLYQWSREGGDYFIAEFSDALKKGELASQVWWERQARKGIWAGKEFNSTTYIFTMKNRFREDYNVKDGQQDTAEAPKIVKVLGVDDEAI